MTGFWLLAVLLGLAALIFLWWPIAMQRRHKEGVDVSRQDLNVQAFESQSADLQVELQAKRIDQTQYDALNTELQRNLLDDVERQQKSTEAEVTRSSKGTGFTAILLSVVVLAGALGLYLYQGSSQALAQMATQEVFSQQLTTALPEQRISLLETKVRDNPQDADSWYALANVYLQQQHFKQSTAAYERLLNLVGDQPELLAEYAQVLFFVKGNRVTAKVKSLVQRILRVQPDNVSALGLLGIDAFESQRYAEAIAAWQSALDVAPKTPSADVLRQGIVRAKHLLMAPPQHDGADKPKEQAARLTLQVSIDENLLSQFGPGLDPELSVFVLARAIKGPRIPLAVQRLKVKDLPVEVILSDEMAMRPDLKLSSVDEVEVLARVSFSGQPLSKKGDLQGSFRPVNVDGQQAPIRLVIDEVIQ